MATWSPSEVERFLGQCAGDPLFALWVFLLTTGVRRGEAAGRGQCAVAGDLKLMRRGAREELYDLATDPLELAPLSPDELASDRADRLAELRAALGHPAVTSVRPESSSAASAGAPTAEELSEIEERMRLLGYM